MCSNEIKTQLENCRDLFRLQNPFSFLLDPTTTTSEIYITLVSFLFIRRNLPREVQ